MEAMEAIKTAFQSATMEAVKYAIDNMTEQEKFQVLKLLEGTFYMPVVITRDYLTTLLDRDQDVNEKDMRDLNANSDINDTVFMATHNELLTQHNRDKTDA